MAEVTEAAARAPLTDDDARLRRNRKVSLSLAAAVFLFDQATKWVVTYVFQLPARYQMELLPFFDLRWTENTGVSLGLFSADSALGRALLVAGTAAIAAFVAWWLWKEKRRDDSAALALILGGALGNIADRARLGYVVDFADLHFGEWRPFLIFNVGDAAITIGVLLLLVRALLMRNGKAKKKEV